MPIFINLFIFSVIWVESSRIPEPPPSSSGLSVSFPDPELDFGCLLLGSVLSWQASSWWALRTEAPVRGQAFPPPTNRSSPIHKRVNILLQEDPHHPSKTRRHIKSFSSPSPNRNPFLSLPNLRSVTRCFISLYLVNTYSHCCQEESKSWRQLQEEREALMSTQLEKTKCEALDIWNRAKLDDQQRVNKISEEQQRMEEEAQAREEILRRNDEERQARDKARREELRRQEDLLSGRKIRSKTIELSSDDVRGTGIQIYHYKDPGRNCLSWVSEEFHSFIFLAVEVIIRNHHKKEIKRRMSHGEILKLNQGGNSGSDNNNEVQQHQRQNGATNQVKASFLRSANSFGHISGTSSNSSSTSVNEYKNVMTTKPDYFKASVMVRSTSSSSNTSRWKWISRAL